MEILTDRQTKNGQTNRRNYTNFERNLAMMVIYLNVKFEFHRTNRKCPKTKMWTDKRTNEQTEFYQFRQEPSYDGDLSPCQV